MKKNVVLAVMLAMLTVVSTGCALGGNSDDDKSPKSSASDKKDKNKGDKKTSDFSAMFGADDESEDNDEDVTVETEAPTEKETEKETEKTTKPATDKEDSKTATSNCLYDDNDLKIEYVDYKEEYGYLDFNLKITNTSDVDLEVQCWESYINGVEVDAIMSAPVEAGKTVTDTVGFDVEELEENGIDINDLGTLELSFHIFDWEDTIEDIDTDLIKLNLGGSGTVEKKEENKFVTGNELYNDNGMNIKYVDMEETAGGYLDFNLDMKNTNAVDVEVQCWESYINGIEVDAIMSSSVESGKTVTDTVGFELDELEEKGIDPDKIESVELSFHIFSWDDEIETVDTDLIKFKP